MTVRPRDWTWRMSARIELTAVGLSSAARRERWSVVSRTASLLQSGKVEKVEEVEKWRTSWQVQRADARATSCGHSVPWVLLHAFGVLPGGAHRFREDLGQLTGFLKEHIIVTDVDVLQVLQGLVGQKQ
jgi:hypothetical protein